MQPSPVIALLVSAAAALAANSVCSAGTCGAADVPGRCGHPALWAPGGGTLHLRGGGGTRHGKTRRGRASAGDKGAGGVGNKTAERPALVAYNEQFVDYYRAQGLTSRGEWPMFMDALARPLPLTFRLCGPQRVADMTLQILQELVAQAADEYALAELALLSRSYHESRGGSGWGDHTREPPPLPPLPPAIPGISVAEEASVQLVPIAWLPGGRAYQLCVPSSQEFKKSSAFADLREGLIHLAEAGAVARQELVSMLPVHLLGILPHHKVLDMCASPGSKTRQILQKLAYPDAPRDTRDCGGEGGARGDGDRDWGGGEGFVVANDLNAQRCRTLVHQLRWAGMDRCIVLNNDARDLPSPLPTDNIDTAGGLG